MGVCVCVSEDQSMPLQFISYPQRNKNASENSARVANAACLTFNLYTVSAVPVNLADEPKTHFSLLFFFFLNQSSK